MKSNKNVESNEKIDGPTYLGALALAGFFVLTPTAAITYATIMYIVESSCWSWVAIPTGLSVFALGGYAWINATWFVYRLMAGGYK